MGKVSGELMDEIEEYMNEDIREAVYYDNVPCSNERFLIEYCKRDSDFKEFLFEIFNVDLEEVNIDLEDNTSDSYGIITPVSSRDVLIRRLDSSFVAMVNASDNAEYMYEFGQYNAYLSVLFMEEMISPDEYRMMIDLKLSFYFSITRNEVVFN